MFDVIQQNWRILNGLKSPKLETIQVSEAKSSRSSSKIPVSISTALIEPKGLNLGFGTSHSLSLPSIPTVGSLDGLMPLSSSQSPNLDLTFGFSFENSPPTGQTPLPPPRPILTYHPTLPDISPLIISDHIKQWELHLRTSITPTLLYQICVNRTHFNRQILNALKHSVCVASGVTLDICGLGAAASTASVEPLREEGNSFSPVKSNLFQKLSITRPVTKASIPISK